MATYVRTDQDQTTIVSPRVSASGRVADVLIDGAYSIDVWSGASIDIRTAATPRIDEVRHEIQAGVGYEWDDVSVSGRYRLSVEPDYVSHSGTLHGALDLAQNNTTLAIDLYGGGDDVGRVGDPSFHRPLYRGGGRLTWTQVLGPDTIAALSWETVGISGYQASPYRFVAIGGEGTCASAAPFCIAERHPEERVRSSLVLEGRQALGSAFSLGLGYRLYFDSWGLVSHAASTEIAWRVVDELTVRLSYRYYTQSEASFYRPRYFDLDQTAGYFSRDRKLSAFYTNEVALGAMYRHPLDELNRMDVGLRLGLIRYDYLAFVGLDRVYALEITALGSLVLP